MSNKIRMPYRGKHPYIFVSYSHKNTDEAIRIVEQLQSDGYRVWYYEGIDSGIERDENIASHIEHCSFFIALLSQNYMDSSNCKNELSYAGDLEKPRLLIYLEDIHLSGGMRMRLSSLQAVHKYRYDNPVPFYEKLYASQGMEFCFDNSDCKMKDNPAFGREKDNFCAKNTKADLQKERKMLAAGMKALCFTLSGKTAFFKKPEMNAGVYFTYGNIHKVALNGIFGAVLGYGGHTQKRHHAKKMQKIKDGFPEFYKKLHGLHVAVSPDAENGFIRKKIQAVNNSFGYAPGKTGRNFIRKEQWLEEPSWKIYVLIDCAEAEMLCTAMTSRKCIYLPYLGKNEHFADICDVRIEEADEKRTGLGRVSALFPKGSGTIYIEDGLWNEEGGVTYKYEEKLPIGLDGWTNNYILESFIYTDAVVLWTDQNVYCIGDKNIMFY